MIRKSSPKDSIQIAKLTHALDRFGMRYVPIFKEMCEDYNDPENEYEIFVYADKKRRKITAFIVLEWKEDICEIHGIVVDPKFQRQGLATLLLNHVETECRRRNIKKLHALCAETENIPSLTFFQKHNFQKGQIAGTYPEGQVAIHLNKELR